MTKKPFHILLSIEEIQGKTSRIVSEDLLGEFVTEDEAEEALADICARAGLEEDETDTD